ncbi:MAG TPA: hypothetical protein VFI02_04545 [Armatimonadota bacterium]|nr:hypothetical protein [Armatimonadota bacterium]
MKDNATPTDAERQAADAVPIVDALLWEISCRKACNLQDIIDDDEIYTELYATLVTLAAPHIANARQAGRQEGLELAAQKVDEVLPILLEKASTKAADVDMQILAGFGEALQLLSAGILALKETP